jgi:RecA/RadA recombinase
MCNDFTNALKLLEEKEAKTYLSTGSPELDELLGKGIEPGTFYLFYGNP